MPEEKTGSGESNQSSKVESIMHAGHVTLIGRFSGIPSAALQCGHAMAWVALS